MTGDYPTDSATRMGEATRMAFAIADANVVADIEALPTEPTANGTRVNHPHVAWRDTRPMLSEDEHSPQEIDMARQALYYADLRRLIARHPERSYLVRFTAAAYRS